VKKRGVEKPKINLLDLIPVRNIEWEKKEDGLIVLLKPKFELALLRKHILPRLKKPYFKIKLDHVGSFIWEQCDGSLRVKEVAKNLKDKFGEDVEPLYDRLALFLQSLEKNRFIFYKKEEK
jgi:hypothetical protein